MFAVNVAFTNGSVEAHEYADYDAAKAAYEAFKRRVDFFTAELRDEYDVQIEVAE